MLLCLVKKFDSVYCVTVPGKRSLIIFCVTVPVKGFQFCVIMFSVGEITTLKLKTRRLSRTLLGKSKVCLFWRVSSIVQEVPFLAYLFSILIQNLAWTEKA